MRSSYAALVLATVFICQVAAGPVKHSHAHFHDKKNAGVLVDVEAKLNKKTSYDVDWSTVKYTYSSDQAWSSSTTTTPPPSSSPTPAQAAATSTSTASASTSATAAPLLTANDASKLLGLGFVAAGTNAVAPGQAPAWFGSDGPYSSTFVNNAGANIILVIWGDQGSWVNKQAPLITHSMAAGASCDISFASDSSGAWAAIYPDTKLVNGQVFQTWGEYTFCPTGVVDVSREVNMNGNNMQIVGPQCTTSMDTCVFQCPGRTSCEVGYELLNCTPGSQPGAQYGTYGGAASGGCGWLGATSVHITTTFS